MLQIPFIELDATSEHEGMKQEVCAKIGSQVVFFWFLQLSDSVLTHWDMHHMDMHHTLGNASCISYCHLLYIEVIPLSKLWSIPGDMIQGITSTFSHTLPELSPDLCPSGIAPYLTLL